MIEVWPIEPTESTYENDSFIKKKPDPTSQRRLVVNELILLSERSLGNCTDWYQVQSIAHSCSL